MRLEGQIVPESDDEYQLLEGLYEVTAAARKQDVQTREIVIALEFVAASIMAMDENEPVVDPPAVSEPQKRDECPRCGVEIDDVKAFIGGDVELAPCGCYVDHGQVPGWLE